MAILGNKMKRNKKGSVLDLIYIGGILLFFSMIVLFSFMFGSKIDDQIQGMDAIPTEAKDASTSLNSHYTGILDNSFLILTIGLAIGSFILAGLVRVHPVFLVLFLLALILIIFFTGVYSNIYQEVAEDPQMKPYADQLVITSNIMEYLPFIVGIFGSILAIVMFKLWQNSQ